MVATRRMSPYAAVLAAALTLGACSGADPAPAETGAASTVSSSSSSAPSPTSSVPPTTASPTTSEDPVLAKIPKEARPETPEGAEAFVRFYFSQLNRAFRVADPSAVNGLAGDSCAICTSMLQGVKDVRSKQRHYASDLITVQSVRVMDFVSDSRRVLAQVRQNEVRVLNPKGAVVQTIPAGSGSYVFTLNHLGHWQVVRVQKAKS